MDQKLKDAWVAALESGEYEQCYGRRREGEKFCALGVLDQARKQLNYNCQVQEIICIPDKPVHERWRLLHPNTPPPYSALKLRLSEGYEIAFLNDTFRFTFHDIATLIKEHL